MSPVVTMVRHGQAAAGWADDLDPGLSDIGRQQAEATADELAGIGPLPILVSPLKRCRETAAPFAARWGIEPVVDPAVGEIVSPADSAGLDARGAWLRTAMRGAWADLGDEHHAWKQSVLDRVLAIEEDTLVVSHFIAINVVVGAALGDDRVVCFAPDNCSWTVLEVDPRGVGGSHDQGDVRIVELGQQATTEVR